jgi:hypothetical protein
MPPENAARVLVLVRDLIFSTKIRATADAVGAEVRLLRDPAVLKVHDGVLLIVDLNLEGAIAAAAEWRGAGERRVVGFVSHVDAETIRAAREAGIGEVLARSRFVEVLPSLLRD